jgi:hypothetical protein
MPFWDSQKGDVPYNDLPNAVAVSFGSGSSNMLSNGLIAKQINALGVQPGATGADNVLAVFSLPASSFDVSGRGLAISAQGSFGATANNKRIKIIWGATAAVVGNAVTGGTTIADTGTVATNASGWAIAANVFKYGGAGSNTQIGLHQQAQVGAAVSTLLAPALLTATENAAILIAVTGNATTAVTDILLNLFEIEATN